MDQIILLTYRVITADRPRRRGSATRRAQHPADNRDRLIPHQHTDDHRRARNEINETAKERLSLVLSVMFFSEGAIDLHHFEGCNPQALGLEPRENRSRESPLNAIGFENDQSALHEALDRGKRRETLEQ
jgi:hypothetical protein